MPRQRTLSALVALCIVSAGCAALGFGGPPTVTVANEREAAHEVAVYTVPDGEQPAAIGFNVTTESGDRRVVSYEDVFWTNDYRNATPRAADGVSAATVGAGENVTLDIDHWDPGETIVVVIKSADSTGVSAYVETCDEPSQKQELTLESDGTARRASTCT